MVRGVSDVRHLITWYDNVPFRRPTRRGRDKKRKKLRRLQNTTMVEKYVTISKLVDVVSQVVVEPTCVSRVGVPSPITGALVVVRAAPLLSVRGWYQAGLDTYTPRQGVRQQEYNRN